MEKNFFMIWVGEAVPKYAEHALNAFKTVNPEYSFDLIQYIPGKSGEWEDKLKDYKVRGCTDFYRCLDSDDSWHRCMLSILMRYWLIQTYGGIYADCDMFPIKPLDELSSLDRPFRITKIKPPEKFVTDDANFIGCPKGLVAQEKPLLLFPIKLFDFEDEKYIRMRDRFFDCSIEVGEHYNDPNMCFVDHYDANTYGRNKLNPFTEQCSR